MRDKLFIRIAKKKLMFAIRKSRRTGDGQLVVKAG